MVVDMTIDWKLTVDCASPALAAFWAAALEYVRAPPPEGSTTWEAWLRAHDVPEDVNDTPRKKNECLKARASRSAATRASSRTRRVVNDGGFC